MKKFLVAAAISGLVIASNAANAQNRICGTDIAVQSFISQDPTLQARYDRYETEVYQRAKAFELQNSNVAHKGTAQYNVAVVFHIVLSQAQIDEIGGTAGILHRITTQMEVLNRDFNGQNYNNDSSKILPQFKSLFGNANISFGLAHKKPDGSGTLGVEYKIREVGFTGFDVTDHNLKYSSGNGLSAWDNTKYLNIWITRITTSSGSGQVLGYAYNPGLAKTIGDQNLAGVAVDYRAFGRRTNINQMFYGSAELGRTMVHEIGHYFTLKHIWGNTSPGTAAATCSDDDSVGDTPVQKDANQTTCPSGVKTNCNNAAGGEMYMNYMDYVQDQCMVMFSKGQVTRMQAEFAPGGGSYGLQFSGNLMVWPTEVSNVEVQNNFDIVPNPSGGVFNLSFPNTTENLKSVTIVNMMGQTIKQINNIDSRNNLVIDITGAPAGLYSVNCLFTEGAVTKKIAIQ